jgi:hypothetical protein
MIDRRTLGGQVISAVLVALFVRSSDHFGNQLMSVDPHSHETVLPTILRSLFGAHQRLDALGCACLRALPQAEKGRDRLSNILLHGALRGTKTITASHDVRRLLAEQVRNDFATGAVVSVDHWLLSLTETRVYALSTFA